MRRDFKEFIDKEIDNMAENYIELWVDSYDSHTLEDIEYDLRVNLDISSEIEFAEERLGRELSDEEYDELEEEFIKAVLRNYLYSQRWS